MPEKKTNQAASIKARLTNQARAKNEELQNLLMRFASERLLYRLSTSEYRDRFLLKGAALFAFWFDEPHRPTKDLDLLGEGDSEIPVLEEIFREICKIDGKDSLLFLAETVAGAEIREEEIYQGIRIKLIAMLEKARIHLQVDIGFGDAVTPEAKKEVLPTILDLPAPILKVYPKETVIAEKFEAMVKLGIGNSRMKDFWDLNYLIKEFEFDGSLLQKAIQATFESRKTDFPETLPIALTDEFAGSQLVVPRWTAFITRNRITRATDFSKLIKDLREFFAPLIDAGQQNKSFIATWNKEMWNAEK